MDLSGQSYLANYDQAAIDGSTFDGGVYALSLGRTSYSGMFVNIDILGRGRRRHADDLGRTRVSL